eukprot:jgi/Chlat1/5116/Chrsp33S05118
MAGSCGGGGGGVREVEGGFVSFSVLATWRNERELHAMMDEAKKRAERRAAFFASRQLDPQQTLRIVGTPCVIQHSAVQYHAIESEHTLIPWNGKEDTKIDRFDGRALLDFIREYDRKLRPPRQKTEEEEELEENLNFERYRDLVRYKAKGFSDQQGLADVDNILEERAAAIADRSASRAETQKPAAAPGQYSSVGFSYDSGPPASSDSSDESEASSVESDQEDKLDHAGQEYNIERFSSFIRKERREKAAEAARKAANGPDTPGGKKLNRKERRKLLKTEKEDTWTPGRSVRDPYRSRSRSRSPRRRWSPERHRAETSALREDATTPEASKSKLQAAKGAFKGAAKTDKPETPAERLKRIMSKQLNKAIKKSSAEEEKKRREQERGNTCCASCSKARVGVSLSLQVTVQVMVSFTTQIEEPFTFSRSPSPIIPLQT